MAFSSLIQWFRPAAVLRSMALIGVVALTTTCGNRSDFPQCNSTFPACDQFTATLLNLYSPAQDAQLGAQVAAQIAADPAQFPILDRSRAPRTYQMLEDMRNKFLATGRVDNKDAFQWEIRVINDPNTLNAFCTPGGYIYVYTGLIKFLDREDDLAGVMGHEIAHAAYRHSMRQALQDNSFKALIQVFFGGSATAQQLAQLGQQLVGLSFSRCSEEQADALSVDYLAGTTYNCKGTASFFQKLTDAGQGSGGPTFLSTHPNPTNRVSNITSRAECIKCGTTPVSTTAYAAVKAELP